MLASYGHRARSLGAAALQRAQIKVYTCTEILKITFAFPDGNAVEWKMCVPDPG